MGDKGLGVLLAIGGETFAHLAFEPFQVDAPMGAEAQHDVFVVLLLRRELFFFNYWFLDTLRVIARRNDEAIQILKLFAWIASSFLLAMTRSVSKNQ